MLLKLKWHRPIRTELRLIRVVTSFVEQALALRRTREKSGGNAVVEEFGALNAAFGGILREVGVLERIPVCSTGVRLRYINVSTSCGAKRGDACGQGARFANENWSWQYNGSLQRVSGWSRLRREVLSVRQSFSTVTIVVMVVQAPCAASRASNAAEAEDCGGGGMLLPVYRVQWTGFLPSGGE
jgi:hypothetical protein